MTSWIILLLGGLLYTISILSFFPIIHQMMISRWNLQEPFESSSFDDSLLKSLVFILLSFVILHIVSVIISLVVVMHYSTLLGLILSSISTLGLLLIGEYKIQEGKFDFLSDKKMKKWVVETGITLIFILFIYFTLLLLTDHPWIPFINLEAVIRLNPILIAICIFLGIESLFYWELIHKFVMKIRRTEAKFWYILIMSLFYLSSKCAIFFSLIIWWNLLEIRFIVYGLGLFGLLGVLSAYIRTELGFFPTLIFTILSGLTLYSVFSMLFLLL
jgi:hypothetical protein